MKKTTFLKVILLAFMLIQSFWSVAQNLVPFTPRYNEDIKGDMLLIGNSILNRRSTTANPNQAYNDGSDNNSFNMQYIDVDNNVTPDIFNSSSANLVIPSASASCYRIVYAALYWGAVTKGNTPIRDIKFKMPSGGFVDVRGTQIYDSGTATVNFGTPYTCFADVTSLVTGIGNPNPQGTYTVANVSTGQGQVNPPGLAAGWSLFIVYEDPNLPAKSITSFDGFSSIGVGVNLNIPVSGFRTIPTGPVRAKFAFSALEGDLNRTADNLGINNNVLSATRGTTILRPANNFFNSTLTHINPTTGLTENFIDRNPTSQNTLGYDAGIFQINNNGNTIIANNATNATINIRTNSDVFFYFFNAIALDIIAPNIILTKEVYSDASLTNNIGNQNVTRGQELYYAIGFENIGNDNTENFTITDVLPININFDPNDIVVPNNSGITYSYDPTTRTIVFTIPNSLVEVNKSRSVISFKVRVVSECNELSNACSNQIQNQAFASYRGVISDIEVDDQRSLANFSTCLITTPAPTNFLVGVDDCTYTQDYQLCGSSVVLTAADGYNAYSWSTSPTGTPVIGTTQSITVSQTGTYYVTNTAIAPCRSIKEIVTVSPAGSVVANPVIDEADLVVRCPDNNKLLPKIFLCGANETRIIRTGVSNDVTVVWEKLDESSCPPQGSDDCANETPSCRWDEVARGPNYTADASGQFRVVFNYPGGCFNVFYFNVFKNPLRPTANSTDIICETIGQITVGGFPATGYEFSLNETGPFQTSNVFSITTPGTYTAYIRQQGVGSFPCLFSVPGIEVRSRTLTVDEFVTQPLCTGDLGSIRLVANNVRGQYSYILRKDGAVVNSSILTNENFFDFDDLTAGVYFYEVRTEDRCLREGRIEIIQPDILTAIVNQTKALTCEPGEITVAPAGGTVPYAIYVNGSTTAQFVYEIETPTPGLYEILIIDGNGCRTTTSINVDRVPTPVYNTTGTNVNCYGEATGVINFNMTNANGNDVTYSINNGLDYGDSGVISGLPAGVYNTILKYTLNGVECVEPMRVITISQPAAALTASAGVSQLAGCGPNGEGRVRITNVTGGVAPYEFSFDDQASWTDVNNALKAPGSYILYVRDFNNCIFQAPVTIDPAPSPPNISIAAPVDFNCDGTATSTVTVDNPGNINYTYDYFIDGVLNPNTPPNVFLNVTPGPHNIRIDYRLNSVSTFSNLLSENFGYGDDTTSPGINTAFYCFERQVAATQCRGSIQINDGDYSVTARIEAPFGPWLQPGDHTPPTTPPTPRGRALVVNIGDQIATNDILYQKVINDIIPGQPINFELYAFNLLNAGNNQVDVNLRVALIDASGTEISFFETGDIPKSERWEVYPKTPVTLNPGANTSLRFIIRSNKRATSGNDVAIDDIRVFQLPEACITSRTIQIEIPTGEAFEAQVTGQRNVSCAGAADGGFTITARNFNTTTGFEYSLNNGGSWSAPQFTSPVVINTLGANTYTILVRPVGSAVVACSKSFSVNITAPAPLTLSASASAATCLTGATITATGGGGTPAYQYELREVISGVESATPVVAFNGNDTFVDIDPGDYSVYVRDANGCTNPVGVAVTVTAPPAIIAAVEPNIGLCFNPTTGAQITVRITSGTEPFSYQTSLNGATFSGSSDTFNGPTFTYNAAVTGSYVFRVTDSNGCFVETAAQIINPQLTANAAVTKPLDCDPTNPNAIITTTINGGQANYNYVITDSSGNTVASNSGVSGPTFTYSPSVAGTYTIVITDAIGCTTTTSATVATIADPGLAIAAQVNVSCNGGSDGSVTLIGSGGSGGYTYSNNPTTGFTSNPTFSNLAANTYTFYVRDSKQCDFSINVTITQPANALVATADVVPFECNPSNNNPLAGTVTVNVTSGTGTAPYTYSFNGGAFTSNNILTINNTTADYPYAYVVRDALGCTVNGGGTLFRLNNPVIGTISNSPIYCAPAATTSTVTVPVNGGTGVGTLTYAIISPASAVTNTTGAGNGIFTGLTSGNYVFRVTDANGCYDTESYFVAPVTQIVATATKLTDVDCNGNTTGSIRYTVSDFGTGTYSYTVNGVATATGQTLSTFDLTNRGAGTYVVVFTDDVTSCTASTSVTITQPAVLDITLVSNRNANCATPTSRVTVIATGGTTPYSYAFVPAGNTPAASDYTSSAVRNLNPATPSWDVYVLDANGCPDMISVSVTSDPIPTVTAAGSGCLGTPAGYTIMANNTTPVAGIINPIRYSINNGGSYQPNPDFVVTTAGDYTITMIDGNGCIATAPMITVAPQLTLNAFLNKDITCVVGDEPARITVTPTGGVGPFTYAQSPTNGSFTGNVFTTNVPGDYTFTVTDTTTGCTYTTTAAIPVTAPIFPVITGVTQTASINCNGEDTAAFRVDFNPSLGVGPFEFSIDGTNFQNSNTFTGLSAGPYTVTIRDAKGCTDTDGITITEPPIMFIDYDVVDIQCVPGLGTSKGSIIINGITDGVSTVGGTGGTAPYTYYVTGINGYNETESNLSGTTSFTFDVVDFGFYQIRVVDANGCTIIENDVKVASDPDDLDIVINTTADCTFGGTANVAVAGALTSSGPFFFNIYNGGTPPQVFTADGVDGWQGENPAGSKGTIFTGLLPGVTYTFIVFDDATNCYYFETAATAVPTNTQLTFDNVVGNNIRCTGDTNGSVNFEINNPYASTVTVSYQVYEAFTNLLITGANGTGSIPAGGTLSITDFGVSLLPAGSYYILVRETAGPNVGCSIASANFNILESPELLTVVGTIIKNSNCTDDGIITAQAQKGTGPYTYQVTTSATPPAITDAGWVSGNTFTRPGSLTGITYYVYAKDAYGCIQVDDVNLFQDAPPTIALPAPICYVGTPFTIDLVTDALASATILPATYKVEPITSLNTVAYQNGSTFTFNAAGTYRLYIKDGNGCVAFVDYVVLPQLQLEPELTKVLDCNLPTPNATVTVTATGGTATYAYTITAGAVGNTTGATTGIFTGLDAGNYTFEVNDGACTATTTFRIDPIPATIIATPIVTNVSCNGGNDGTITIDVTSGVGPYEYSLSDGVTTSAFTTNNTFTGLGAGTAYVVTVRNDRDCLETTSPITITEPDLLTATATAAANTTCSTTTLITVDTVIGGTPLATGGYTYSFNGLSFTGDNTFTVNNGPLAATTTIVVRDANNCTFTLPNVVTPALTPPSDLSFAITTEPTCPANTATVQVTATGGLGSLTFEIIEFNNAPTTLYLPQTTAGIGTPASFANLPPGDYIFRVTDENGCTRQELTTVDSVTRIAIEAALLNDITCNIANGTSNNGSASFTVTGFSTTGNYSINVTSVPVGLPFTQSPLVGDVITLTDLNAGTYTVTVRDNTTLCEAFDDITITLPAAITFSTAASNVYCTEDNSQITVSAVMGGTGVYEYAVLPGGTVTPPAPGAYNNIPVLSVDTNNGIDLTWDVYVRDANDCVAMQPVTIVLDPEPTVTATVASQCASPYTITATGASGVAPYEYSLDRNSFQNSSSLSVTSPGDYDVYVRDANGCIAQTATQVTIFEPLQLQADVTTLSTCLNADGVVTLTASGGSNIVANYEYSADNTTYVSSNVFPNLVARPAPYTFYVRDNGSVSACVRMVEVIMLEPNTNIDFAPTATPVTCNGGTDGTISVNMALSTLAVNNNPQYRYTLTGTTVGGVAVALPTQDSPLFTNLVAGDYTLTVRSGRGCEASQTIDVDEPDPIVVPAPDVVQFGCTSGNTGNLATITVDPTLISGGSGTYLNYEFIKIGTPSNTQVYFGGNNTYTVTDLAGGSFIVNVYDENGCVGTSTTPIVIAPYIELDRVTVNVDDPITCNNLEDITVSVATTPATATPNLEYTIVYRPIAPASLVLYPTTTNTDGIFTDLPIGDYNITVRNLDTNCEVRAVHFVNNPNTFELVLNAKTDVTCLSDTNGTATITLVDRLITTTPVNGNDAGDFTYTLFNAAGVNVGNGNAPDAGPFTLTGLAAGTYTINATLSQTPGCTVTTNFTIAAPSVALDITETHTEITCVVGNNDGSISVAATGGWPGAYQFELVGPTAAQSVAYGTQTVFRGLTAGSYTVNVRDSRGCVNSEIVVLNNPTPIAFTAVASTTRVDCINDTSASIDVTTGPTGGSGSYLYTLIRTAANGAITTSGPQIANTFTNLGAGTYQVLVSDSWSCSTPSAAIFIDEPTRVTAALTLAAAKTCATNATITLTASGGTAPYDYSTTADFASATAMPSNSVNLSVPVGTYSYYIRDNNGCISFISNGIKIDEVPALTLALDVRNARVNCVGDRSGVIVAVAQGGLGNYVYTLLDSAGNPLTFVPTQTTPGNFTELPAGNYIVRVVSEDCAAVNSTNVPITEPLVPLTQSYVATNITCAGEGNGRIVITASGGTGIIKYAISPRLDQFFDSGVFENLRPGFYEYIVQDENGCFENIKDIEITEPGSVFATVVPNSEIPEVCAGDANGAFSINITGGNAPYSVSLNDRNGTYDTGTLTQSQFDFSGLSGNEQIVYIRDANGCESDFNIMLGEPVTLNPQRTIAYDCVNNTQVNSVTITVDASNDPADLDYALDGSTVFQDSNVFSNLSPGRHTVDVRHTNGCIKQVTFVIDQVDPITISLADGGLNEIVATATGGFGNYQFSLNGEPQGNKNSFIIYRSGDYTVTVTDANGCTATATRFFEYIDIKIPNVFTPNGDGNNDTWAPTNTINYKDLNFEVFDRYGRKLGSFREGESWDGKYNGTELPSGDYWYILRLRDVNDPRQFVGHFTLYR